MTTAAQQSLQTAWSHLMDVEKDLPSLASVASQAAEAVEDGTLMASLKSNWAVGRKRNDLLGEIALAEKQIAVAEATDPQARLPINHGGVQGDAPIPLLKGICAAVSGQVQVQAGNLKDAERKFRESIGYQNDPETHYFLGLVLADLKRPREACESLKASASLDSSGEIGIAARKELGRLEAKRVFGDHWFVGSWKIAGVLALFAIGSFFIIFTKGGAGGGIVNFLLWGGCLAAYLKFKLK